MAGHAAWGGRLLLASPEKNDQSFPNSEHCPCALLWGSRLYLGAPSLWGVGAQRPAETLAVAHKALSLTSRHCV